MIYNRIKILISRVKNASLVKDSFWALFGNIIKQGLSLLSGIIVARILGKELYGEFGTIKTTLVYIAIVSTFGFGYTSTKYISEYLLTRKDYLNSLVKTMLNITLIFSIILALFLFIFSNQVATFINAPHLDFNLKISALTIIVNALVSTQIGILSGFKAFKDIARSSSLAGIVTFLSSIIFTYFGGLDGAVFSLLLSFSFQAFINWYTINRKTKAFVSKKKISRSEVLKMISFSTPIALQESLYSIVHWISLLILIRYATFGEVGLSSAAALWQSLVIFIPGVLKNVMFSYLISTNDHKEMLQKILIIYFVTTIVPVLFVITFNKYILALYGESFMGLKPVLIVQACAAIFISLSEVYCYEFISLGKPWIVFFARLLRDSGVIIIGYLFVIHFAKEQALWMSIASILMNIIFFFSLLTIYKLKVKI